MSKRNILLKRDWLESAALWEKSAKGWSKGLKKGISGWSPAECLEQVEAYAKMQNESLERAAKSPVKIVLHYEDGTTEVIE